MRRVISSSRAQALVLFVLNGFTAPSVTKGSQCSVQASRTCLARSDRESQSSSANGSGSGSGTGTGTGKTKVACQLPTTRRRPCGWAKVVLGPWWENGGQQSSKGTTATRQASKTLDRRNLLTAMLLLLQEGSKCEGMYRLVCIIAKTRGNKIIQKQTSKSSTTAGAVYNILLVLPDYSPPSFRAVRAAQKNVGEQTTKGRESGVSSAQAIIAYARNMQPTTPALDANRSSCRAQSSFDWIALLGALSSSRNLGAPPMARHCTVQVKLCLCFDGDFGCESRRRESSQSLKAV